MRKMNKDKEIKVLVILGPTTSGKSDLAVALAKIFNGEVISADSRQVYRGLDIGTGKITKKETRGIPHHLLNVVSPKKQFSAHDFINLAQKEIEEINSRGKLAIVCGGTGFYISTLLGEMNLSEVPADKELRKELDKKSTEDLFKILQKLDKKRSEKIDHKNRVRLIRAIEIAEAPKTKNFLQKSKNNYKTCKIGLKIDNEELKKKISLRLEKRLKNGMIAEAKKLFDSGLSYKRMRELGLEYRYLAGLLQKKINKKEFKEKLNRDIYKYARRQMTWFKRDKKINWFRPEEVSNIENTVNKFL